MEQTVTKEKEVELIKKYELVIIVDSHLSETDKEKICDEVKDVLIKAGVKINNSQVWLEKQEMSFPINKCESGTYYLINFEAEKEAIAKISAPLKLKEKVLRFLIVRAK